MFTCKGNVAVTGHNTLGKTTKKYFCFTISRAMKLKAANEQTKQKLRHREQYGGSQREGRKGGQIHGETWGGEKQYNIQMV